MIIVTTNDIPGYRIKAVLGEVMGLTVRPTDVGISMVAGLATPGSEVAEFTKVMYDSRHEVMSRMVAEADQRGANAIIAMRYDSDTMGEYSEVCAYGTAVVAAPIPAGQAGATDQSAQLAR